MVTKKRRRYDDKKETVLLIRRLQQYSFLLKPKNGRGVCDDTHFILSVIPSAFASLYPAVPVTYRKKGGRNI